MTRRPAALAFILFACACGRGLPAPVDVASSDACTFCRMTVADAHVAAQVVARGEEPRFFDDIGCLAGWLKDARVPDGGVAFVADHRSARWVRADRAVYTKASGVSTPMASSIIAHADRASRDADPAAMGGRTLSVADVFGSDRLPGGDNGR
jgi:copper chaperone NosL